MKNFTRRFRRVAIAMVMTLTAISLSSCIATRGSYYGDPAWDGGGVYYNPGYYGQNPPPPPPPKKPKNHKPPKPPKPQKTPKPPKQPKQPKKPKAPKTPKTPKKKAQKPSKNTPGNPSSNKHR